MKLYKKNWDGKKIVYKKYDRDDDEISFTKIYFTMLINHRSLRASYSSSLQFRNYVLSEYNQSISQLCTPSCWYRVFCYVFYLHRRGSEQTSRQTRRNIHQNQKRFRKHWLHIQRENTLIIMTMRNHFSFEHSSDLAHILSFKDLITFEHVRRQFVSSILSHE